MGSIYDPKAIEALRRLRDAVVDEVDLDAVGPKLGEAVNAAEELLEDATAARRADAFLDQSKW